MVGRSVVLFLKSPLYPFRIQEGDRLRSVPRDISQLQGQIVMEKGSGVFIKVTAMGAEDLSMISDLPFSELFIPFAKVDYILMD